MILHHLIVFAAAETAQTGSQPSFLATLGINWKLFLAQLVNFAIVIFVLWRWVMKPVVGALEARRQKIEDSVRQAQEIETRMKAFETERDQKFQLARVEAEAILKKATASADSARQEITLQARAEAERILAAAKAAIEADKQQMLSEIREEVASFTVMATEKILREKLGSQKDKELIQEVFKSLK
jgi:F-type H+-transporting ATPase subunit b